MTDSVGRLTAIPASVSTAAPRGGPALHVTRDDAAAGPRPADGSGF